MDKAKELVPFCARSAGIVRTKLSTRRMRRKDLYTCETSMQDWLLGLHYDGQCFYDGERGRAKERIFSDDSIGIRKEYIPRRDMVCEVVFETIAMGTRSQVSPRQ